MKGPIVIDAVTGETITRRLTWKTGADASTASPVDLTGWSAVITIRNRRGSAIQLLSSPGTITLNARPGGIDFSFVAPSPGRYDGELRLTSPVGKVKVLVQFLLIIDRG